MSGRQFVDATNYRRPETRSVASPPGQVEFRPVAGGQGVAGCEPAAAPASSDILDGRRSIAVAELAELAHKRAEMGANWLAGVVRPDGSFRYVYRPDRDKYVDDDYNEVRHAGVTMSLFQAYEATGDPAIRAAADAAVRYIDALSLLQPGGGRAYAYLGRTKLGGQALALVALLERRRVTADTAYDGLIDGLAAFLRSLELPADPGRYYQSFDVAAGRRLLTPRSDYYPGEALLALTRLARYAPDGPDLAGARRAADYLIRRRDGDIIAAGRVPRDDHWLTIALSELWFLEPNLDFATVALLQAKAMLENQYTTGDPWRIGGARRSGPINFTSTATKGEALMAAWNLALALGQPAVVERIATGALRTVQFAMRVQYTADSTRNFPRPERAVGGWAQDETNPRIRIDFVQHNLSALLGAWHLTSAGRLPGTPADAAG